MNISVGILRYFSLMGKFIYLNNVVVHGCGTSGLCNVRP